MGTNVRRAAGILIGVFGVLIGVTAVAWACTEAATVSLTPHSGPAGSTTTVTGRQFEAAPVSIRWNTVSGRELASAQGPNFAVSVRIPADAVEGERYVVYAVQMTEYGVTRAEVFTVAATQSASGQRSGGDAAQPGGAEEEARAPGGRGVPAEQQPRSGAVAGGSAGTAAGAEPERTDSAAAPAAPAPNAVPVSSSAAGRGSASVAPQASPSAQQATPASRDVPGDLPVAAGTEVPAAQLAPPSRTAAGDLWRGFTRNGDPARGPGLNDSLAGGSGDAAGVPGVALLAIGLVVLFGGGAVAARQRRLALSERH